MIMINGNPTDAKDFSDYFADLVRKVTIAAVERGDNQIIKMSILKNQPPDYDEVLDEVREVAAKYNHCTVLWTGDINAAINKEKPNKNAIAFNQFCLDQLLTISPKMPTLPTYHHFVGGIKSTLDYFIHRKPEDPILKITIESRNSRNVSMHDPVTARLKATCDQPQQRDESTQRKKVPARIQWDKADKVKYREATDVKLTALKGQMQDLPSEILTYRLNTILSDCARSACPPPPLRKRKTRYKWHASFKPAAENVSSSYRKWKEAKSPTDPSHPDTRALKVAKQLLWRAQRQAAERQ